jgi:hypothetical protein
MPSNKPTHQIAREKATTAKGPESPIHLVSRSPPPQGRKSKADIIANKLPAGIYLRSCLCQGSQEVIFITNQTLKEDAFTIPLQAAINKAITDGDEKDNGSDPVGKIGLTGIYYMRKSLTDPDRLLNVTNSFQRKAFLRVLDEDETSAHKRLQALQVIKRFMEQDANNRFHATVFIQTKRWDITPDDITKPLPKLDHFLQYSDIVKIIREQYNEVDEKWAAQNPTAAMCFFTEGHIPFQAHLDLGFPVHFVMGAPDHQS